VDILSREILVDNTVLLVLVVYTPSAHKLLPVDHRNPFDINPRTDNGGGACGLSLARGRGL
jgi:hypothetical protein